ncbi:MAG: hypothetical protein KatS3mg032_2481 [Cyclobacteriaceae bacterium]|nr:MAG: hypothetical protein KatS3mg032_2481 [Cyclobacteriaceae bacterium]
MGSYKNLLFIINKHSGRRYVPGIKEKIHHICAQYNAVCVVEFTQKRNHACQLAREAAGRFDAIIAVGGDGTVNETARGLLHSATPMGIIPTGSGNGLARHLGIPMNCPAAARLIFNSVPVNIDTFTVNGQTGVNVAGLGFDGHVAGLFSARTKRGLWGYTALIIRDFLHYQPVPVTARMQGHTITSNLFILAIANSSQYGNKASIAPSASLTDHYLNLVQVKKIPLLHIPPFVFRLFTRKLSNNRYYSCTPCRSANIELPHPVPYHIDGEACGRARRFEIRIQPSSLRVLIPAHRMEKI